MIPQKSFEKRESIFTVEVIQHIKSSKRSAIGELISHEIDRPCVIGPFWHSQWLGLTPL
jgi:hypothetical protein